MVKLFDIAVNISNHNHKEARLNFDNNCYEKLLGSPSFKITTLMTSLNVAAIPNTSPVDLINDGIYNDGPFRS